MLFAKYPDLKKTINVLDLYKNEITIQFGMIKKPD
jgi:hypothetical protein